MSTAVDFHSLHDTANTQFKRGYSKYIRNAIWGAFFLHFVMFIASPEWTIKPYSLKEEQFEVVDVPDNIEIPPPPAEIQPPKVPVEAADDDDAEDEEIAPTTFDSFDDMPPPPPPTGGGGNVFLAFDEPPSLIDFVAPKYPSLAREAGIEGTVAIRVVVSEEGKVIQASILSSDVTPAMEKAALEAAKKCKFRPAKQRTVPVKAAVMIPFQFLLN
jgi:protein TonB